MRNSEERPITWSDSSDGTRASAIGRRNASSRVWKADVIKTAGGFAWGVKFGEAWSFLNESGSAETMEAAKQAVRNIVNRCWGFWFSGWCLQDGPRPR